MTALRKCANCGADLPGRTWAGICPRCLVRVSLASSVGPKTTSANVPSAHTSAPVTAGQRFGDYELLKEIARGGFGVVFKARQLSLNRTVAVKILLAGRFATREAVHRFQQEAQTAASLQHPNIVPIHEIAEHDGTPFFSMDYVDGQSLSEVAHDQPLAPRRAAAYVKAMAEAIQFAHERGVLHRDLKPSNALIDSFDQPRITDFGLAKRLSGDSDLTVTGQVLGTPSYAAPEQVTAQRGKVGPASDVYSLGAILYHLMTTRPPFVAENIEATLLQVLNTEPVAPRLLNPNAPADLETICLKCLEKEPARRYRSAQELADELNRFLQGEPIHARPVGKVEKAWRWCRRKPLVATLLASLLVVFFTGFGATLWQWRRAEQSGTQKTAALIELQLQRAEDLFEKDESSAGLALLARVLRDHPEERLAGYRIMSALTERTFPLLAGAPLPDDHVGNTSAFGQRGPWLVTATNGGLSLCLWDVRDTPRLVCLLEHEQPVRLSEFSADAQRLATISRGNDVRVWDIANGQPLGEPFKASSSISRLQFNADGTQVLLVSAEGGLQLRDAVSGAVLRDEPMASDADFSPDALRVVIVSANAAQVRDAKTWQPVGTPLQHPYLIYTARFSPDSQRIVTASDDRTIRVWDALTGRPLTSRLSHHSAVRSATFSPDGKRLLAELFTNEAQLWDAVARVRLGEPFKHDRRAEPGLFSPDGRFVLSFHGQQTSVRDAATGRRVAEVAMDNSAVTAARFTPDGRRIVISSYGNRALLWEFAPGQALPLTLRHDLELTGARFSPDGRRLLTTSRESVAGLWDAQDGSRLNVRLQHERQVTAGAFSPDGDWIVTASRDGMARIWNARTGEPAMAPLQHQALVNYVEFSPDGRWVLTASDDGTARVWDAKSGQPIGAAMRHDAGVRQAGFSPDGLRIATAGKDSVARIWEAHSGKAVLPPLRVEGVGWIEFSPDSRFFAVAGSIPTAQIFDAHTGAPHAGPLPHDSAVRRVRFSRDGRWVLTASDDHTARVWDARTGAPISKPMIHADKVHDAAFSPDGRWVLTASEDRTARVWEAKSGYPVTGPLQHSDIVVMAEWSPDGKWMLTASRDQTAKIWELPFVPDAAPSALLAAVAEHVANRRLDERGYYRDLSTDDSFERQARLLREGQVSPYASWLKWFFADRSTRPISPSASVTVGEYNQRRNTKP